MSPDEDRGSNQSGSLTKDSIDLSPDAEPRPLGAREGCWKRLVQVEATLETTLSEADGSPSVAVELEPKIREPNELQLALLKQIEFYFSDGNLRRDTFLRDHIAANEGWAMVSVIADFGKVKQLTGECEVVAHALLFSCLLEVDETRELVRTCSTMPEFVETLPRTICVENLRRGITIEGVEELLAPFGHPISYIQIPQDAASAQPLGFAFVEFVTAEAAMAVVKLAAEQAADARSVKSWRAARDPVHATMKADWDKQRKKGKSKERKQDRKEKQNEKKRIGASPGLSPSLAPAGPLGDPSEVLLPGGQLYTAPATAEEALLHGGDGAVSIAADDEWWKNKGKKEKKKYEPPTSSEARPTRLKLLPRKRAESASGGAGGGEGKMAKGPEAGSRGFGAGRGRPVPAAAAAAAIPTPNFNVAAPEFKPFSASAPEFAPMSCSSEIIPGMFDDN